MKKIDGLPDCSLGSWLTIPSVEVVEVMSQSGFDWLAIDMEHSAIVLETAQAMIRVMELLGVKPLVRVGVNDQTVIKRVMDAGSHGVIVPMVNTRDEAARAVGSVKYPPQGFRGVGLARAQKYGFGFDEYRKWNAEQSLVIVQIEHIRAVENLDFILDVDGVDGFFVGPYDLSASLGVPGQFDHPDVVSALGTIHDVSRKHDVLRGVHVIPPDAALFRQKAAEGYNFIALSLDSIILGNASRRLIQNARGAARE